MVDNPTLIGGPIASVTGELGDANQIVTSTTGLLSSNATDAQLALENLQSQINEISASGVLTGRNFERVNTDLVIDATNAGTYAERIIIYAAGIDKRVQWQLPTSAQITAAGETFPYVFETVHLGGTTRIPSSGDNRVDIDVQAGDTARIRTSGGLMNLTGVDMLREDRIIWSKADANADWFADRLMHDSSTFVLPSGVVEIRDEEIQDVTAIATELGPLTINKGDAFRVADADGGTYFGRTIVQGDLLLALVDNPSVASNSEDFAVLDTRQSPVPMDLIQLARETTANGNRLDFSRNVFVNESNVIRFNSMASNTPTSAFPYFTSSGAQVGTARSVTFSNQNIQFTDLVGGTLSLSISFQAGSFSGFLPDLTNIEFAFAATTFTFPLTNVDPQSGSLTVDITIPNEDYTNILNTNCNITLNYQFRGATFTGVFTIMSLVNTLDGSLRQAVTNIAQAEGMQAEQRVNNRIDQLAHEIDEDGAALQAIQPRISPYKTLNISSPAIDALYNDSSGSDPFPTDLGTLNQVSADNPRFTGGGSALFIAVIAPGSFALRNITTSTDLALQDSEASVTLGESLTQNGDTYFVYRVTGLTTGHVYEIERQTQEQVVAWPDDISNLQDDVERIDAELEHALLNLSDEVVQVFEHEVSVTEETTPTIVATDYNKGLGNTASQTVFYEPNANSGSGGTLNSRPFSELTGDQVRRKLLYIPAGTAYTNQEWVTAFDGTTGRGLISYVNGTFNAKVFVPAKAQGSSTETVYPAPATQVSGAGIWQNIPLLTFQNGIPVPEADELFFTRNLPSVSTTLTIQYRGHANGNVFGASSTTLAGVGGSSSVSTTFTLNVGSESATVEVRWNPSSRTIRVSATERVGTGLPTINDLEVILSYTETRTIPATPATTRDVPIEFEHPQGQVFAFKPSSTNTLVIVGDRTEIDTGYSYTTLFGGSETGFLTVTTENATFLNYEDFEPIATTVTDLENHATLPQFGLFSTQYTEDTTLVFDVSLQAPQLNLSNLPTSASGLSSGDIWNNGGVLNIVP